MSKKNGVLLARLRLLHLVSRTLGFTVVATVAAAAATSSRGIVVALVAAAAARYQL